MALLTALFGLWVVVGSVASEDDRSNSMPPFMLLSPPDFKAGHMVCSVLYFRTELQYSNYTLIVRLRTISYS